MILVVKYNTSTSFFFTKRQYIGKTCIIYNQLIKNAAIKDNKLIISQSNVIFPSTNNK